MTTESLPVGSSRYLRGPVDSCQDDALASCVGSVEDFLANSWCQRPKLMAGVSIDSFAGFLALEEIEQLLWARGIRGDQVRAMSQGSPMSTRSFTGWGDIGNSPVKEVVQPANLMLAFSTGATVILDDVSEYSPSVRHLCAQLARSLGSRTQASVYITPPGRKGLKPHRDDEHVLVLQLHGRKRWQVGDDEDSLEVVLEPGDCLYVPARTMHAAESLPDAMSVHLTVGVMVPTVGAVLQQMISESPSEHLAVEAGDRAGLKADLQRAIEAIADVVGSIGESELLDQLRLASLIGRPGPVPLALSAELPRVDGESLLRLLPDALIRVRRIAEHSCEVTFGGRRLTLPWDAAARVLAIRADRFRLCDVLGPNAPAAAAKLSRLLVAEGMAVPIEGESALKRRSTSPGLEADG